MALVVENGDGLSTAESYISTADADTYIAAFKGADATWDGATSSAKEVAARQATQYIDGLYNWIGEVYSSTQALDWPRNYVYDERGYLVEGIPTNLEQATAEVMFLIIAGTSLTVDVTKSKRLIRKKIDVIEYEYELGASNQPSFPAVSRVLAGYIHASGRTQRG